MCKTNHVSSPVIQSAGSCAICISTRSFDGDSAASSHEWSAHGPRWWECCDPLTAWSKCSVRHNRPFHTSWSPISSFWYLWFGPWLVQFLSCKSLPVCSSIWCHVSPDFLNLWGSARVSPRPSYVYFVQQPSAQCVHHGISDQYYADDAQQNKTFKPTPDGMEQHIAYAAL